MSPLRIQRKRTRGWRMPANTVSCTRPGRHGNPFYPGSAMSCAGDVRDRRVQVACYRDWLATMRRDRPHTFAAYVAPLRGRNLACWCKLCAAHENGKPLDTDCANCTPCHVDPLGTFANRFSCDAVSAAKRRRRT